MLAKVKEAAITKQLFDEEKLRVVRDVFCKGLGDAEVAVFVETCKALNLDPIKKEIFAVKKWDAKLGREVMVIVVALAGLRSRAAEFPEFAGVQWLYCGEDEKWRQTWNIHKDGPPFAAKAIVHRKDWVVPCEGVAMWTEYAQYGKSGDLIQSWKQYPTRMIAKCAEAHALRAAFPREFAGCYIEEEMNVTPSAQEEKPKGLYQEMKEEGHFTEAQVVQMDQAKAEILAAKEEESTLIADLDKIIDVMDISAFRAWVWSHGADCRRMKNANEKQKMWRRLQKKAGSLDLSTEVLRNELKYAPEFEAGKTKEEKVTYRKLAASNIALWIERNVPTWQDADDIHKFIHFNGLSLMRAHPADRDKLMLKALETNLVMPEHWDAWLREEFYVPDAVEDEEEMNSNSN